MKLFLIEDDTVLRTELARFLEKYGYECQFSDDFKHIVEITLQSSPDLILLDLNLPYLDGCQVCRELRKQTRTPIIVVTSRSGEMDELICLNLGADDFIAKPYNAQILLAHIEAVLRRRTPSEQDTVLTYGELMFYPERNTASFRGREIELTKNESRILTLLLRSGQKILSRNELMDALWQSDVFVDDNTLTVNVNRLRKKLAEIGLTDFIKTKHGQGYCL